MMRLTLPAKPTFPLDIYRPPLAREDWLSAGATSFKAFWPGGVAVCKMTQPASLVKIGRKERLRIYAVPVGPVGEVWDALGTLCHLWFQVGDAVYEATKLNGWNPVPAEAPRSVGRPSDSAVDLALLLSEKVNLLAGHVAKLIL